MEFSAFSEKFYIGGLMQRNQLIFKDKRIFKKKNFKATGFLENNVEPKLVDIYEKGIVGI